MLKDILKKLPNSPGVYLYTDAQGELLYVGKAIDLKKRVSSYFHSKDLDVKTAALVEKIADVSTIVTKSEAEALILEDALVKKYQPQYNIDLKDNKRYPYFRLSAEQYPKLTIAREKKNDGAQYFGPYPGSIQSVLRLIDQLFCLRKCNSALKKNGKGCLYSQLGQCLCPCTGKEAEYPLEVERVINFIKKDYQKVVESFEKQMADYSKKMRYEEAADLRDRIKKLEKITERQTHAAYQRLRKILRTPLVDLLKEESVRPGLERLKTVFGLPEIPERIDCFDISHIQGSETVASMTVLRQGKPDKKSYRRYILEQTSPDDFASMEEVLTRRYYKVLTGEQERPDLIIIDGGKGQLSSAVSILKKFELKIPIASIAKKNEELFVPGRANPIILKRSDPGLRMVQIIRDEAHRFAVTFHRLRRSKRLTP